MISLLIIADDFTGALDTGVQFAANGIYTRIVTDPEYEVKDEAVGRGVLVIDAETRHLPSREAYEIVFQIVQRAKKKAYATYIKRQIPPSGEI